RFWHPLPEVDSRVDLRSGRAFRHGQLVQDREESKRALRFVNSENTLVIGVVVALLTGANAFQDLPPMRTYAGFLAAHGTLKAALLALQIGMTGAAAGVGSSFWYDLLGMLIQMRRTKAAVGAAAASSSKNQGSLDEVRRFH